MSTWPNSAPSAACQTPGPRLIRSLKSVPESLWRPMRSEPNGGNPREYTVNLADLADADIDQTFVYLCGVSVRAADKWQRDVLTAVESLSWMPYRCALAPEDRFFDQEIRLQLFHWGQSVYRILYTITEYADEAKGEVRILRVMHGSREWRPEQRS